MQTGLYENIGKPSIYTSYYIICFLKIDFIFDSGFRLTAN